MRLRLFGGHGILLTIMGIHRKLLMPVTHEKRIAVLAPVLLSLFCMCLTAVAQPAERTVVANRSERTLHQFQGKDGAVTFTNRPEKYKHRRDFVEVVIKYERIPLPPQYKPTPVAQPKVVTDENLRAIVSRYASLYGLSEPLVYAVIRAESNFNPNAVSPAGARGLMQLMPGTAAEMGVTDIFDPTQNVAGGTQYLSKMFSLFNDKRLALAAYNAGPENVKKHKGIPPFEETKNYVRMVMAFEEAYAKGAKMPVMAVSGSSGAGMQIAQPQAKPSDKKAFIVHFHSGLTQPADQVHDKDPYWYIEYGPRVYPVRKDLVKAIEKA